MLKSRFCVLEWCGLTPTIVVWPSSGHYKYMEWLLIQPFSDLFSQTPFPGLKVPKLLGMCGSRSMHLFLYLYLLTHMVVVFPSHFQLSILNDNSLSFISKTFMQHLNTNHLISISFMGICI
jgi:hypothetical protein